MMEYRIKNNGEWIVSEKGMYKRKDVLSPTDRAVGWSSKQGGKIRSFQTYFASYKLFSYDLAIQKAREFDLLENDEGNL